VSGFDSIFSVKCARVEATKYFVHSQRSEWRSYENLKIGRNKLIDKDANLIISLHVI
jgi:hypothetical protein